MKKRRSSRYTCGMGKNLRMNDEVYALRREVMGYLYEAKNFLRSKGIEMPRVTVRVTDNDAEQDWENALGVATLGGNVIWISLKALGKWKANLREIVYHEIVHAVTGFGHDPKCPLMSPCVVMKPLTKRKAQSLLLKYFG